MAERPTSKRKREIMQKLCQDSTIVGLIDNPAIPSGDPYQLINRNIFPMLKIPGLSEEATTVICTKLDYPNVRKNDLLKNTTLTFTVLSHVAHNTTTTTGDARTDLIIERIIEMFAFDDSDGFRWELTSDMEGAFNESWYGRTAIFHSIRSNGYNEGKRSHG